MQALMGDLPLTLDLLARRAEQLFPDKQVVTALGARRVRTAYAAWSARVQRYPALLAGLGVSDSGRVASLCWSTQEHLELYFGVPSSGRVLHTLNPRFSDEQLAFVVNEAEDEVVVAHASLTPKLFSFLASCPTVRHVVVIDDGVGFDAEGAGDRDVHEYEDLLGASGPSPVSVTDERRAAVLCHTGGTTGDPKGVLYSHRSLVLQAMAVTAAGGIGIHERDVVMPVVPLFHANAVGFAHAAVGTGATLVLPGPDLSGPALADLIEQERVSVTCGVPTVWTAVLPELAGQAVPELRTIISGASAVPPALSEQYEERVGVPLTQIWGMTETSPLGTITSVVSALEQAPEDVRADLRTSVGLPVLGVETRIVDDEGEPAVRDGSASGELQVRGPWVSSAYFGGRSPHSFTDDGWLRTGDIASVDGHGYIRIVDRAKDVIKSGGEWISSIDLENHLMSHPAVTEAAVVGVADDRWGERPVAFVVASGESAPEPDELRRFLTDKVPTWWIPERVEYIDEIPKTSVGKFSKATLRERMSG